MRFLALLALAAPLVSAIAFTDPAANATLTKAETFDLTWTTVDTDPTTFSIYLVNFVNYPPFYTDLATDIETALGTYSVRIPCDVDASYGFQFNAINGTNVYVIYAQSPEFTIDGADCTDPTTSASSCAATATVTVTVSPSSNSTVTPTSVSNGTVAATSVSQGTVPNTIGWNSGYSNPVTLTAPCGAAASSAGVTTIAGTATTASPTSITTVWTTVYADAADCCADCES